MWEDEQLAQYGPWIQMIWTPELEAKFQEQVKQMWEKSTSKSHMEALADLDKRREQWAEIIAAAVRLVKCKGRYHFEQNMEALTKAVKEAGY